MQLIADCFSESKTRLTDPVWPKSFLCDIAGTIGLTILDRLSLYDNMDISLIKGGPDEISKS